MEGDSVTICTHVNINQQEKIKWYFNNTIIALIKGDLSVICTDVQCKGGDVRFRDRLKLDHHTGSLNIRNITNTHSGNYTLIIMKGSDTEKIFKIFVHGVSAAKRDEMKRKSVEEGESVTLGPGEERKPNDVMTWYFNDTIIARDRSKDVNERFRGRLKLDHQTGSLTIMNTRNTDDGEYKLQISSCRFNIIRSFSVSVTGEYYVVILILEYIIFKLIHFFY
ncbi:uncharacterized protein LOC125265461 [Megalobrama amblycephala]|uniref:uncharacterized protein LOC125265461 n=1 Tax=Megalobrama amblycephala TaxID=75352 RepID=UPI0020143C7E|nr:uncharacterized protein LOC125265461 [Megalobrama amblycephala]